MKELIYREDALNFDMEIELDEDEDIESFCKGAQLVMEHIKAVPAAEITEFMRWVAREIFRENFDGEAFRELACRKLWAFGIVKKDGGNWTYEEDEDG